MSQTAIYQKKIRGFFFIISWLIANKLLRCPIWRVVELTLIKQQRERNAVQVHIFGGER